VQWSVRWYSRGYYGRKESKVKSKLPNDRKKGRKTDVQSGPSTRCTRCDRRLGDGKFARLGKDGVQVLSVLNKVDLEVLADWESATRSGDCDLILSAIDGRNEGYLSACKNALGL
jgi:hypothetical protein